MSVARGFPNAGHYYSNIVKPIALNCNFVVDSSNGNGLGIRSLKSNGFIQNVFMHTSAALTGTVTNSSYNITSISGGTSSLQVGMPVQGTDIPTGTVITAILSSSSVQMSQAATGSPGSASITYQGVGGGGQANPNPLSGFALIQFKQNFNYYLGGFSGFVSPVTGSVKIDNSALTVGQAYIISTLGNSSLATWQSVGVPQGLTPSVGMSFIATSVGGSANVSTSRVSTPNTSGITSMEVVGDPNQSINNSSIAVNGGAYVLVQFLFPSVSVGAYTPAGTVSTPTGTISAPTIAVTSGTSGNAVTLNAGATLEATGGGTITASVPTFTGGAATFTGTPASLSGTVSYGVSAPRDNSVVGMTFFFDGSSVSIDGL